MDTQPVVDTAPEPPTEFTIGGRTYELVPFLKEGEHSVHGDAMVERAQESNANLGEEDGTFILAHQDEIPQELRGKINLVFTGWRNPSNPQNVANLNWNGNCWSWSWFWLDGPWYKSGRLVRRKNVNEPTTTSTQGGTRS